MFHQPRELQEALQLKASLSDGITAVAGGTDLMVARNRGEWRPGNILDLTRISELRGVTTSNSRQRIAAATPYSEIINSSQSPALLEAARGIGGPQVRNRGTIGGNLGTASPAGDACVALLALGAEIEIAHAARGRRTMPACDFFLDYRKTALQPDELIIAVNVPAGWSSAWYKIGKRGAVNISVICCAIGRSPSGKYCIALGCVGPYPRRAVKTEALLNGSGTASRIVLSPGLIAEAADLILSEVEPIDDHRASAAYRRAMCAVLLKRLLSEHFAAPGE